MSDLSKKLREEAKQRERLADIADALDDGGLKVEGMSPLADWVIPGSCDLCGCTLEAGACYCCNPVFGYGEGWHEQRHPDGVKNAGNLGRPSQSLADYVRENN